MPVSEYLRKARLSSGLSQRDVAAKLGYSTPQFISNWERGISYPPVNSIKRLAALYGVQAQEMFDQILAQTLVVTEGEMRRKFKSCK